jgi:threonine/homoserine/homoserine lactone efflux protein
MDAVFLLRGLVLGFSIAAPVGPIGVLCIRRTLAYGRRAGLVTGLGAASADAVYGSIAAFGLTAVSGLLLEQQQWLRLLGGLYLCFLGVRALRTRAVATVEDAEAPRLHGAYASTFLLTLTNPVTIISFAAIFAGLGLVEGADYGQAATLVLGVFAGSMLWWTVLSGGVSLFRARFGTIALRWVNVMSGLVLVLFGLLALLSLLLAL